MPRFDVHVDDPDQGGPHDFRVWTPWESDRIACHAAARRAVLLEGSVREPAGDRSWRSPWWVRLRQAMSYGTVELTAQHAVVQHAVGAVCSAERGGAVGSSSGP